MNTNQSQQTLEALKKQVDEIKTQAHRTEAQKEVILQQLQEKFEVSSLEEANELLQVLTEEHSELEQQFNDGVSDLITRMKDKGLVP